MGAALVLLAIAVACAAVVLTFVRKFYPNAPEPRFGPPRDAAEGQRQDLEYFQSYFALEKAYAPEARARAMELFALEQATVGSQSPEQFDLALARIVALADNGHSRVQPLSLARRHPRLPCRLYRFDDGFRVLRARPACVELLGAKITAIEGRPIEDIADAMYPYFGGPRNHYDQFAAVFFLESPELLSAAGLAASRTQLRLHAQLPDGSERDVAIDAAPVDPAEPHAYSDEYLSPRRLEGEPIDWATFLPIDAKLPAFLRAYDDPFQAEYWADPSVYYVLFRSNEDEPGHPIAPFVARVTREIAADRPRSIVLDLRLDQGGNFTTTASLLKDLTVLADSIERVFVLTSAWTFSAGDVSLALVKEHGGAKVVVIGAPAGDRIRLWAEGAT